MIDSLRVITFNTAVGNPRIQTDQRDFLKLPFYREVIEGAPEAPILALQEVGAEQASALKQAAVGGKYAVLHICRPGQGNALLIPQRFSLLEGESHYLLRSQLIGLRKALGAWVRRGEKPDLRQLGELRMWIAARLTDTRSRRDFTIFTTHLSGNPPLRLEQARELFGRVSGAIQRGPVIVAGDLNTRTAETATVEQDVVDAQVRALFEPLKDMGEHSPDRRRSNIDYVLAHGFTAGSSKLYTGSSLQLPGLPSAEFISDHYAEEDALRFAC